MLRSLYMKQYVFFVQMQSHVLAALLFERYVRFFGSLHLAFEMSCDTEYLEKTAFDFFGNVVFVVLYCKQLFGWFLYKPSNLLWAFSPKKNTNFPKWRWVRSKNICLRSALSFSLVVIKKYVLRTSWGLSFLGTILVYCSNAESRFACASFRRLRLVLWLFTSCVWDVVRHRIHKNLIFFGDVVFVVLYCVQLSWCFSSKPSEKYWSISPKGKHKLSKTTMSTFEKCLFELSFAFFSGCNYKNCFVTFLSSLYLEKYVFFVRMHSHVSAAPVLEGFVWYFGSLHPGFEMSCDIEYL